MSLYGAGKGSKRRPEDLKKITENYPKAQEVEGNESKKPGTFRKVYGPRANKDSNNIAIIIAKPRFN